MLWYSGSERRRNEIGILVDEELRGQAVKVKRVSDRVMTIKLIIEGSSVNICSAYMPQTGLEEEEKKRFWEVLDEVIRGFPSSEIIFIGGDFNGNVGSLPMGYDDVHGGFGFRDRNIEGVALLEFAGDFGKEDRAMCKDCKVISSENLATQHRLLVMDLVIKKGKKRRGGVGRSRVR
ncbi:uncharacterized protein LOC124885773 [Capsicum annuum]|uniref:uncharacterized protein LOC124885773 n=1 Tax=Capsicum annuum TaxID=4072 RepID=UPI001FB18989|nr:uncharacterized protein LOC124885773 [Capsicum annuum]